MSVYHFRRQHELYELPDRWLTFFSSQLNLSARLFTIMASMIFRLTFVFKFFKFIIILEYIYFWIWNCCCRCCLLVRRYIFRFSQQILDVRGASRGGWRPRIRAIVARIRAPDSEISNRRLQQVNPWASLWLTKTIQNLLFAGSNQRRNCATHWAVPVLNCKRTFGERSAPSPQFPVPSPWHLPSAPDPSSVPLRIDVARLEGGLIFPLDTSGFGGHM